LAAIGKDLAPNRAWSEQLAGLKLRAMHEADDRRERDRKIARREALVLTGGPRIPALEVEELGDDLLQLLTGMIQVNSAVDGREQQMLIDVLDDHNAGASAANMSAHFANLPEIMRTMLRHPELFSRQMDIGLQLLSRGALPKRDRELVILRVAWLCQAPYEWGEHVHIAKSVGIASEEIERITYGSDASGWSEHERALLRATEELRADALISDATWSTLTKTLDQRQLIELPIVVGQYQTVAYYQNSLRLRLHDGNPGLTAR
jgi:alkylhydroperoxidase family enzyme